jgi:MerR family redox-sensitive transcriptional activator SoxR
MASKIPAMPELTIGELSARSGVAVSALHFYEAQGLISSRRTAGNQRRFRRDTLRRVALVKAAHQVGIPLRAVQQALDELGAEQVPSREQWRRLSARWRDDLDARIAGLEGLRDRLAGCIGCGCLSLDACALVNPGDALGERGPGAHNLVVRRRR